MDNTHAGHRKRLRTQYLAAGANGMPDHLLLEMLLSYAIPRRDTNPLAHTLLERFGSLEGVFCATRDELLTAGGIGEQTAALLLLVFDLHQRMQLSESFSHKRRVTLLNTEQSCRYALTLMKRDRYETVRLVCLNAAMRVLHEAILSVGVTDEVCAEPRHVIEQALFHKAHAILLMHNHPTGNPLPSRADRNAAQSIDALAQQLQIQVLDHLIVGAGAVYSHRHEHVFLFPAASGCQALTPDAYRALLQNSAVTPLVPAGNASDA